MDKEFRGTFFALLTAFVSGFSIVANKFFIVDLDPTVFTAVRAMFIGFGFLLISTYKGELSFKKTDWKSLLAIGVIGGGIAFLLFFTGLKLTTAGRAAFLHKTLPIYVTILAFVFLKEKVSRRQVAWLLTMLAGTYLISVSSISFDVALGDVLVIIATILWAIESVLAKETMRKESNFVVSFGRMFFGAVFLFGLMVVSDKINVLMSLSQVEWFYILASTAILFCYVFFWYWSIKLINVSKASILLLFAPVISLVLGVIMLGEQVFGLQLVGSALILIGAWKIGKIRSEFV